MPRSSCSPRRPLSTRSPQNGFTLIELMVVVAIIALLAAIAAPTYTRYMKKASATEATVFLQKLYVSARAYYLENGRFPASITSSPPPGSCCQGNSDRCVPQPSLWEDETWIALNFSVDDPHYFSYQFTTDGSSYFYVRAFGDLDCDGSYSTYQMMGEVDTAYGDGPAGTASVWRRQAFE